MGSTLLSTLIIALTKLDRHEILRYFCHESVRKVQRFRLFGQLPGRNKLKGPGSRLLVSPFPEIKFIACCCRVL